MSHRGLFRWTAGYLRRTHGRRAGHAGATAGNEERLAGRALSPRRGKFARGQGDPRGKASRRRIPGEEEIAARGIPPLTDVPGPDQPGRRVVVLSRGLVSRTQKAAFETPAAGWSRRAGRPDRARRCHRAERRMELATPARRRAGPAWSRRAGRIALSCELAERTPSPVVPYCRRASRLIVRPPLKHSK